MNSKVTVVAHESGAVINKGKNPDYGFIKLVQTRSVIDEESGFLRLKELSTLLHGRIDHLMLMNYQAGQELEGNIIIVESMKPFNSKNPTYDIKKAGITGIICTVDGKPIYRKTKWTRDPDKLDTFIEHDEECKEKLRAAFKAQKSENSFKNLNDDTEFNLEEV